MKKLFFLCAFLFMSMQIQAQMYIIYFDFNDDALFPNPKYQITTISPDGTVEIEDWDANINPSYGAFDPDVTAFYVKLQEHVSPLLDQGYRFIDPFIGSESSAPMYGSYDSEHVFFLAVP